MPEREESEEEDSEVEGKKKNCECPLGELEDGEYTHGRKGVFGDYIRRGIKFFLFFSSNKSLISIFINLEGYF